jgi:RNA polymerase sigma-70 factor (ECF subfamily)
MSKSEYAEKEVVFTQAFNEYEKGLCDYCRYKLHNAELARDLVQETFLKTWKYLAEGGEVILMKAFLYRVLNCLIIDEYRKRKAVSLDELFEKGYDVSDWDSEKLVDHLDGMGLISLIGKLPEKYKTLLTMRFPKEMTISEISEATQRSKNLVSVQIYRGLRVMGDLARNG